MSTLLRWALGGLLALPAQATWGIVLINHATREVRLGRIRLTVGRSFRWRQGRAMALCGSALTLSNRSSCCQVSRNRKRARSFVPNRLDSRGMSVPLAAVNNNAGPPD